MKACGWDDVTAMYKKEVLLKIPFRKISYGEDAAWAKEALAAGYTLVYQPSAAVFHYHNEDYDYSFRRMLTVMHLRYREFGFLYGRPRRKLLDTLRIIKTIWKSEPLTVKEKWKWFVYNQQQHKAGKDAYDAFRKALDESEEKLDDLHEKICGIPPSPLKPVNNYEQALG